MLQLGKHFFETAKIAKLAITSTKMVFKKHFITITYIQHHIKYIPNTGECKYASTMLYDIDYPTIATLQVDLDKILITNINDDINDTIKTFLNKLKDSPTSVSTPKNRE